MTQTLHLPLLWAVQSADIKRRTKMHFYAYDASENSRANDYLAAQPDEVQMGCHGLAARLGVIAIHCPEDEDGRRDKLVYKDGAPIPVEAIIQRLGITRAYWDKLIPHLEAAGVVAWLDTNDCGDITNNAPATQDCSADAQPESPASMDKPAPKQTAQENTAHQRHKSTACADSESFGRFWAAYPKKVGKGAARKAWGKAGCGRIADRVIAAVEANKARNEQWRKDHGQYIPHPATWLNQERWEDELGTAADVGRTSSAARTAAILAAEGVG